MTKEQKWLCVSIDDRCEEKVNKLLKEGWRIIQMAAMGGGGKTYGFCGMILMEKDYEN